MSAAIRRLSATPTLSNSITVGTIPRCLKKACASAQCPQLVSVTINTGGTAIAISSVLGVISSWLLYTRTCSLTGRQGLAPRRRPAPLGEELTLELREREERQRDRMEQKREAPGRLSRANAEAKDSGRRLRTTTATAAVWSALERQSSPYAPAGGGLPSN